MWCTTKADGGEEAASTMEMKREGVRYLMEVTRDARQEETLKEMLQSSDIVNIH